MPYLEFTPEGVVLAYMHGVFPMHNSETDEIEWYRPDPRAILPLDGFHTSRSLARTIRRGKFTISTDRAFMDVMRGCNDRRTGNWISAEFYTVYGELYRRGIAHSIEVWLDSHLVGGLYGVALGAAFMAESMFHYESDASKVALAHLVGLLNERQFTLLDVQYVTPHLASLGAVEIRNSDYIRRLHAALPLVRSLR